MIVINQESNLMTISLIIRRKEISYRQILGDFSALLAIEEP